MDLPYFTQDHLNRHPILQHPHSLLSSHQFYQSSLQVEQGWVKTDPKVDKPIAARTVIQRLIYLRWVPGPIPILHALLQLHSDHLSFDLPVSSSSLLGREIQVHQARFETAGLLSLDQLAGSPNSSHRSHYKFTDVSAVLWRPWRKPYFGLCQMGKILVLSAQYSGTNTLWIFQNAHFKGLLSSQEFLARIDPIKLLAAVIFKSFWGDGHCGYLVAIVFDARK